MSVLGIRYSNKDFTYAVMDGSKKEPVVRHVSSVTVPKNFEPPRVLRRLQRLREWSHEQVEQVFT